MIRKPVSEIRHGDVLLAYRGGGEYTPLAIFGEYVESHDDPKVGDGMLKFTMSTEQGATYSAFFPPAVKVVVRSQGVAGG